MQPTVLTPGAYQGLLRTAGETGVFSILAFDQRESLRKMLTDPEDSKYAKSLKKRVVRAVGADATAVLLDDEYGLGAALSRQRSTGLILAVEKSGYSGDSTHRRTELNPNWTVADIKKFGADAVKLLVYYHPDAGDLTEAQEEICREVGVAAAEQDIAYFLEPVLYSIDSSNPKGSSAFAAQLPDLVARTATRLSRTGAHVLKIEFPIDHKYSADEASWLKACEAVSQASAIPWALLSAGVDFPVFELQVEVACRAGASGFLGGRAIWKEALQLSSEQLEDFFSTTIPDRIHRLRAIADNYGRSWQEMYEFELS